MNITHKLFKIVLCSTLLITIGLFINKPFVVFADDDLIEEYKPLIQDQPRMLLNAIGSSYGYLDNFNNMTDLQLLDYYNNYNNHLVAFNYQTNNQYILGFYDGENMGDYIHCTLYTSYIYNISTGEYNRQRYSINTDINNTGSWKILLKYDSEYLFKPYKLNIEKDFFSDNVNVVNNANEPYKSTNIFYDGFSTTYSIENAREDLTYNWYLDGVLVNVGTSYEYTQDDSEHTLLIEESKALVIDSYIYYDNYAFSNDNYGTTSSSSLGLTFNVPSQQIPELEIDNNLIRQSIFENGAYYWGDVTVQGQYSYIESFTIPSYTLSTSSSSLQLGFNRYNQFIYNVNIHYDFNQDVYGKIKFKYNDVLYEKTVNGRSTDIYIETVNKASFKSGATVTYWEIEQGTYEFVSFEYENMDILTWLKKNFNKLLKSGDSESESISDQEEQVKNEFESSSAELESQEQQFNDDMNNNLEDIDTDFDIHGVSNKLLASSNFIRSEFNTMTTNTPFGSMITFSLTLGLALLIIGKVI